MKKATEGKKEIRFIVLAFASLALFAVVIGFFGFHQINKIQKMTSTMYEHSSRVSNSALLIKADVYKIHRDMKNLLLFASKDELSTIISEIDENEKEVYENLDIIKENILTDEGLKLHEHTLKIFQEWINIRSEVIALVKNNKIEEAKTITKVKGAKHVLKLGKSANELYMYAQNRVANFKSKSDMTLDNSKVVTILVLILFLVIFIFIAYLSTKRISTYIYKNEHLRAVLSVIRDVNQLIVREKNQEKLLQESCNILTNNHVFESAWIILLKDYGEVDFIATADESEDFKQFKEKVNKGWIPYCIAKTSKSYNDYTVIEDVHEYCTECPLQEKYNGKSTFNIELKYNKKLFGFLALRVDKASMEYKNETELLEEVAGDIAYALYNIQIEQAVYDLKELYANTINSLENLLFVKDKNFIYLECNKAFERFVGKSKSEIIGKSDYDIFDKKSADSFRLHDENTLKGITAKSNYDWVTYPDGKKAYLFTNKSPLLDANGELIGLVGNSADVTEREKFLLELEQKKRELETIVQEAPNPIILHNEDGKIIMLNKAWTDASGFTLEDIPTVEIFMDKIHDNLETKANFLKHIRSLYSITARVDEGEFTFLNKNRDTIIWQFSSAPLGVLDEKRVIISSAMDITELKKKDEIMMIQSRHAAMGEMISMIAHQWRQPISIVSMIANNMLLDITLGSFDKNRVEGYSKDILEQTEHLSKTIDDFRNFFKPDRSVSKVNLQKIIDEVYSIVKGSLKNHTIKFNVSCESKTEIDGYPRELMQVFVNIINNAKDILIIKKPQEAFIDVTVYEDEEYINTKICDNAGGVPKEIISKIFDPYFTTKDEKTGTGLGLYMSKMIIEDHLRGKIDIKNSKDGACFIVKLPKKGVAENV